MRHVDVYVVCKRYQITNLIWRCRVSVCHLFYRTSAERTANIDINKSIAADIPRRGWPRLRWRKQSRPDAKVTGIFHDSSPAPSFISPPPCPVRYASRRSPMLFHPSLLHGDNPGRRPHHSYRGPRYALSNARTNELAQPSEMFGSTVWVCGNITPS